MRKRRRRQRRQRQQHTREEWGRSSRAAAGKKTTKKIVVQVENMSEVNKYVDGFVRARVCVRVFCAYVFVCWCLRANDCVCVLCAHLCVCTVQVSKISIAKIQPILVRATAAAASAISCQNLLDMRTYRDMRSVCVRVFIHTQREIE